MLGSNDQCSAAASAEFKTISKAMILRADTLSVTAYENYSTGKLSV